MTQKLTACGPISASSVIVGAASVADVAAFEALPPEVQALARRVCGDPEVIVTSLEAVTEAYQQGWDDCDSAWQDAGPYLPTGAAEEAAREILGLPPKKRAGKVL